MRRFVIPTLVVGMLVSGGLRADEPESASELARLRDRVDKLERGLAELRAERANDRLLDRIAGRWVERSHTKDGERIELPVEVVWRLTSEGTSHRFILGDEVDGFLYGAVSVDATRDPAWIDFAYEGHAGPHVFHGLVRAEGDSVTLVLPRVRYTAGRYEEVPRPTSFESTAENRYSVYRLERREVARAGR